MISREQIDEIKSSVDIVDYIDKTNPLTKQSDGTWWKGHTLGSSDSKTSLAVNKTEQYYKNHATGDGGDIYKWVAFKENLDVKKDFQEIVKIVADSSGYKISNINENDEKKQVYATMRAVVVYYHSCLTDEMRQDITNIWGISNETIDNQLIGYAPLDGAAVQMALKDTFHQEDLVKCGIIFNDTKDSLYRARYVFPYWENGNIVYSIGRRTPSTPLNYDGKKTRKYLKQMVQKKENPEVSKYITNNVIFGVDYIKDHEEIVICEGVTDAIILHQAGITAISPITTSFKGSTLSHVLEILKPFKRIFICNDNEKPKGKETKGAGDKGADKTIEALTENGLEVRKIQLPRPDDVDKIDLADYMKDHKVEDFRSLMYNAVVHEAAKVTRPYRMNDTGNSYRLYDQHGDDIRYCYGSNEWFIWNGKIWVIDKTGTIQELASLTVESMHNEADNMEDSDFKTKLQKFASSCGQLPKINNMIKRLQSIENIPVLMEDFDLNGWILPVQNGTIDLKTGMIRKSNRSDMATKQANVIYDKNATCPIWLKFLGEILPDPDTQRYMKEAIGYSLTGETSEEQIYIFYGTGSNGKSTFMDTASLLAGDFGINVKASTLLTSDGNQSTPDNEIARLQGARLVTASEPKKGIRLGEDIIKAITNTKSKITGRLLYQEPRDFYPSHKVCLSTNHKPSVTDQSRGMRRRLRLIPFITTIEDDKRDLNLSSKLEKELPGILNWAIEGCLSWQEAGYLKMSDEIERETAEYMDDNDRVTDFLNSVTNKGNEKDMVPHEWLRISYNTWAVSRGFKEMNHSTFSNAMIERDYKKGLVNGRTQWKGLKLIITKIANIHKQYPLDKYEKLMKLLSKEEVKVEDVEDKRVLVDMKTLSSEEVDVISNILKNNKKNNNNGNGSCNIEDIKIYIEKEVPIKSSTNSLDSEKNSTNSLLDKVVDKLGVDFNYTPFDKILGAMNQHEKLNTKKDYRITTEIDIDKFLMSTNGQQFREHRGVMPLIVEIRNNGGVPA